MIRLLLCISNTRDLKYLLFDKTFKRVLHNRQLSCFCWLSSDMMNQSTIKQLETLMHKTYPNEKRVYSGNTLASKLTKRRLQINLVYRFSQTHGTRAMNLIANSSLIAIDKNGNCIFQSIEHRSIKVVIKQISLTELEDQATDCTGDVYGISSRKHRNWRWIKNSTEKIPNISGIHPNRERLVYELIKNQQIAPKTEILAVSNCIRTQEDKKRGVHAQNVLLSLSNMNQQRRIQFLPQYWIIQKHGGCTLADILAERHLYQDITVYLKQIIQLTKKMNDLGVVHGDLTPDNICVSEQGLCRIIDFGWCTHKTMHLESAEARRHFINLRHNFDLFHFAKSLSCIAPEYNMYTIREYLDQDVIDGI